MNNKKVIKRRILEYLDNEHINYRLLNETDKLVGINDVDTLYLTCAIHDVIGGSIETTVRFLDDHCYCQSYYCQPVTSSEEENIRMARACNYMDLHLPWNCNTLFEHSYILDEDNGDVFNGFLLRYELVDKFFDEAMNHILNYGVQQIADVCIPLITYTAGKISFEEFKKLLKNDVGQY